MEKFNQGDIAVLSSFDKSNFFLKPGLIALVCLTGLGFLCFWPTVKHVGFYLDDWIMLNTLANGPDNFWECFKYYFSADVRVVKRPIEALHFLVMFKMFGLRPVGYHVFNLVMEIIAGWLFYFCLVRMTGKRLIALAGASLFLLYPSHNATHYWVVCSSVTLSLIFYFGSLLANLEAEIRKKPFLHVLSAVLFLIGVLNYEVFVPLVAINVLVVFFIAMKTEGMKRAFISSSLVVVLLGIATAMASAYISWIVELVGSAWLHHVMFDYNLMTTTISKGFYYNFPWVAFAFFFEKIALKFQFGVAFTDWLLMLSMILLFCISSWFLLKLGSSSSNNGDESESLFPEFKSLKSNSQAIWLFLLGLITIFVSYTIFGLNDSYEPTFGTLVNRVNTGASIGVTFIFCSLVIYLFNLAGEKTSRKLPVILLVSISSLLVSVFSFTNWSLSRCYRLSWQLQSHIIKHIRDNRAHFSGVKSLLLANVPRYVDEAPVFDGVWDFQPMLRLNLENKKINGGVVSDRLKVEEDRVVDSRGLMILGSYKFDGLSVLVSPQCDLLKVNTANEFIDLIQDKGMTYELNKELPEKWRSGLMLPADKENSR